MNPLPQPWDEEPTPSLDVCPLDEVRSWLGRFIMASESDLDILALWVAHTYATDMTWTTPRLVLDSWAPGSGKTTTLEHLAHLCFEPLSMASISSDALLARCLADGARTLLIDEVDRTLNPKSDNSNDYLAILNSGYKKGGTRPALEQVGNTWVTREFPTYAPVAMAGNSPRLPDDTRSRSITIHLVPDTHGQAEDTDWQLIEEEAYALRDRLAQWVEDHHGTIALIPTLPELAKGRTKERWRPLKRIAMAAGGRWPETVDNLVLHEAEQARLDYEAGLVTQAPALALVDHLVELWPPHYDHWQSTHMVNTLASEHPEVWGTESGYGKALTTRRLALMLKKYGLRPARADSANNRSPRGYRRHEIESIRDRLLGTPK